jgi:hypothetical protein
VTIPIDPEKSAVNVAPEPGAPPGVPRAATPLARKRAWTEPSVRTWWLIALAMLVLIAIFSIDRMWSWGEQNQLVNHGTVVQAKVVEANGQQVSSLKQPPDSQVQLEFDWHGQLQRPPRATLDGWTEYIVVGQTIPIRVDPNDPSKWTASNEPPSLGSALLVGLMFLPLVPILLLVALLKRKRVMHTWQTGEATLGVVVERSQSPIAPLSYTVRCSLRDRRDKRIFTVFVPRVGASLQKNDLLWLILPAGKHPSPVAAMWFE